MLSVLILSWNTKDLSLACLQSLREDQPVHEREILILDNGSEDGSQTAIASYIADWPQARLIASDENLGFAAGNNRLASLASKRYLCLLNSDTEVPRGALDRLVDFLEANRAYGAVVPKLVYPGGRLQASCKRIPGLAVALSYDMCWRAWPLVRRIDDRYHYRDFDHEHDMDVEQPPAACLLLPRALWLSLEGLDEELWLFYNDVDLCKRLLARAVLIRYLASVIVTHHEGASTKQFGDMVKHWACDRLAYYRKHHGGLGYVLVRVMLWLRGWQEWFVLGRRHKDPKERRDARRALRRVMRELR